MATVSILWTDTDDVVWTDTDDVVWTDWLEVEVVFQRLLITGVPDKYEIVGDS